MLSIFDIFKVGVGPSSSHTNGPMLAGFHFTQLLSDSMAKVRRVQVDLYGSLSLTGRGHHTDRATVLGLMGNKPDTIKMTSAKSALQHTIENHTLSLAGSHQIEFSYDHDIVFHSDNLPLHENGMTITALDAAGVKSPLRRTTLSVVALLRQRQSSNMAANKPAQKYLSLFHPQTKCWKKQRKMASAWWYDSAK